MPAIESAISSPATTPRSGVPLYSPVNVLQANPGSPRHVAAFISDYGPLATQVEQMYSIPAAIVLAQAALETGWGKHTPGNMFFGIKAARGASPHRQALHTTEVSVDGVATRESAWFRKYDSPRESFFDYGHYIATSNRYLSARKFSDDPIRFARELQKAGYATDPMYADKLISITQHIRRASSIGAHFHSGSESTF